MKHMITFGEPMVMFAAKHEGDLAKQRVFEKFMAGAETNVAIGMARLGFVSSFASRVGKDSFGRFIMQSLEAEKIDTSHIFMDTAYPTGYQVKSRVSKGDPVVEYYRQFAAVRHMDLLHIDRPWVAAADHLHATGIPLALSASMRGYAFAMMEEARQAGLSISFDPNLRPVLWPSELEMRETVNRAAALADLVLPGLAEGQFLTGCSTPREIAEYYLNAGAKAVVVKLGGKGAYYRDAHDAEGEVAGFKVEKVVDTVGAGDGFAVGVISALLEGLTLAQAARRGNAIGALAVQSPGDSDGLPDRKALEKFMKEFEEKGAK